MEEKVVLVNPNDDVLGVMEKMQAHQNGLLQGPFQYFV
jgi:isopentenyl-diphosphate delta-isomerase